MTIQVNMRNAPEPKPEPYTIPGHPATEWFIDGEETGKTVTLCAECGAFHTIIMLVNDRWYCSQCRTEGTVSRGRTMIPIS